jgi:hypothetical protein
VSNPYYRIKIYPDPSDHTVFSYMEDDLVKTKYTVNFLTGTVDTERVKLGPYEVDGKASYQLTPVAASNNEFWSFPDLVALWRTGNRSGDYELELEFVNAPPAFAPVDGFSNMTLMLDNAAPLTQIQPLQVGGFATPYVYTPGPLPASDDLLDALLGSFPGDYGAMGDPTCQILSLLSEDTPKYLAFKLTASHASSYLRYWHFRYERNDGNNEVLLGKEYDGATSSMTDLAGVRVSSVHSSPAGFQDKFLYLDADHLEPGTSLEGCAYRFVIAAATRATDGYHYLRYSRDQDLHYVQK